MTKRIWILPAIACFLMVSACSKGSPASKKTTPETGESSMAASGEEAKLVPLDQFDAVEKVWQSAFSAIRSCVEKRIEVTKQKGIEGYLIVAARIGLKPNPIDIRIKENKLKVDGLEPCIQELLSQVEFPTWGYWAESQYSYSFTIGY